MNYELIRIAGYLAGLLAFLPFTMMYLTWLERKVVGRLQGRYGPNRVGKFGLLQPIADGIKMLMKEDIVPDGADTTLHLIAPVMVVVPSLLIFSVIPFGRGIIAADLNIGVVFFLAMSSLSTIAIFVAGWASRNKFSLMGAMRVAAQLISYEVPMVFSLVVVIMAAGSLSTVEIVKAQEKVWFFFTPWGFVGFLIFFISAAAEVNRCPFDIPEGESEIVAGFHTEYSGMKFALFYMAEFLNAFAVCALAATLFFGGWMGPLFPSPVWFLIKTYALYFILVWVRGTLPRLRVDQLMGFAWKLLFPASLLNILLTGIWYFVIL